MGIFWIVLGVWRRVSPYGVASVADREGRVGERSLLTPSPLRTVRASFPAYGSSLYKVYGRIIHRLHSNLAVEMDLNMTIGVHQNAVP